MTTNIIVKFEELKKQMNNYYIRNNNLTIPHLSIPMKRSGVIFSLVFLVATLFSLPMSGQFVVNGGVSPKVKWMQAEGDSYNVIYPKGADSLALRYLWQLEQNRKDVMLGLGGIEPSKLPVVLYNSTMYSNGMVVWAPKRMELYTLPAQRGTYPMSWESQLALHESRHVGQISHFTKGIFKLGSVIIGQQSPSIGVGIYPSRWFLEGDAVVAETELSSSGRGRTAEFMEYYRAAFLEGDHRNWARWKLDSYRYYTPDRYTFGYLIGSTIRYKTGNYDYAGELLPVMVRNFYNPNVRDYSYTKVAGAGPKWYFEQGKEMMTGHWQEEMGRRGTLTQPEWLLAEGEKDWREYLSPVKIGADSIVYIKHSYSSPAQLVLVTGGREKVIKGITSSVTSIKGDGTRVWFTEKVSDARWSNQVYGDIFSYSLESGKVERLTRKCHYAYVVPASNGKHLNAVAYYPQGGSAVEVLDAETGSVVKSVMAPQHGQITYVAQIGSVLYALCITDSGAGLYSLKEGEWSREIDGKFSVMEELGSDGQMLYFLSDMDGVRNVYTYSPQTKELARATNAKYGASAPMIEGSKVYYSDLRVAGREPAAADLGAAQNCGSEFTPELENGEIKGAYRYFVADELSRQAKEAIQQKGLEHKVPYGEFAASVKPEKYSRLGHLFRIHSWAPLYYNVDKILSSDYDDLYEVVSLGATVYSQNTLGTAVAMLGYSHYKGSSAGHFKMSYSGLYPVLEFSADVTAGEKDYYRLYVEDDEVKMSHTVVDEPLVEVKAKAYLPINLSGKGWQRALVPMLQWEYANTSYYSYATDMYHKTNAVTAAVRYYRQMETARSAVFPKFGYGGMVVWRGMAGMEENFGSQAALDLYGYLPGFAPTHGIKLSVEMQKQFNDGKMFYLSNLVNMPRGYADDVFGQKYVKGSAEYAFPVYLGDWRLFKLAYLKRLKVIPYLDYAVNIVEGQKEETRIGMYSYGAEALVDFSPITVGIDLSLGVRYSRNGNDGGIKVPSNSWQVFVSTALF